MLMAEADAGESHTTSACVSTVVETEAATSSTAPSHPNKI